MKVGWNRRRWFRHRCWSYSDPIVPSFDSFLKFWVPKRFLESDGFAWEGWSATDCVVLGCNLCLELRLPLILEGDGPASSRQTPSSRVAIAELILTRRSMPGLNGTRFETPLPRYCRIVYRTPADVALVGAGVRPAGRQQLASEALLVGIRCWGTIDITRRSRIIYGRVSDRVQVAQTEPMVVKRVARWPRRGKAVDAVHGIVLEFCMTRLESE